VQELNIKRSVKICVCVENQEFIPQNEKINLFYQVNTFTNVGCTKIKFKMIA